MKLDVVRTPLLVGSVVGGVLILLALLAILTGSTRWDDHLINAAGVFAGCALISLVFHLVIGAFRPPADATKRARIVKFVLLLALMTVGLLVFLIAWALANMSVV